MNAKKTLMAIGLGVTCIAYPQVSAAQEQNTFKSTEVLSWNSDTQSFYLETSIRMAGIMASRANKTYSECLGRWYNGNENQRHADILDVMRKYPENHPQGIIIAVMEKECGSIM